MPLQSTELTVAWVVGLLLAGAIFSLGAGGLALSQARQRTFYARRRQTLVAGWQRLGVGLALLAAAGLAAGLGKPGLELVVPPTFTPTISPTPTRTPSTTPTPSVTPTASRTPTITPTAPPTDTPTPTLTPTPSLPLAAATLRLSVTPPAEAVAANLRFSQRMDCQNPRVSAVFDRLPKTVYAHFDYDGWAPGMAWAGAWYRDGELAYVETGAWDGSTGGCGYSSWNFNTYWWLVGEYEVQIFAGERWLLSGRFSVARSTPTP